MLKLKSLKIRYSLLIFILKWQRKSKIILIWKEKIRNEDQFCFFMTNIQRHLNSRDSTFNDAMRNMWEPPKKRFSQDKLWLMFMISRTRLSQNTMISSVNSRPEIMNSFCFMMGGKDGNQIILLPPSTHFTNPSL